MASNTVLPRTINELAGRNDDSYHTLPVVNLNSASAPNLHTSNYQYTEAHFNQSNARASGDGPSNSIGGGGEGDTSDINLKTGDEVFDQIFEHIIKQNNQISNLNSKRFRRFRLQQMKNELDDLEEEEEGKQGFCKRLKTQIKQRGAKLLPSAFRKLSKLEKHSKGGLEDAYRVVKQIDILRLKLKITDFASAILGVG